MSGGTSRTRPGRVPPPAIASAIAGVGTAAKTPNCSIASTVSGTATRPPKTRAPADPARSPPAEVSAESPDPDLGPTGTPDPEEPGPGFGAPTVAGVRLPWTDAVRPHRHHHAPAGARMTIVPRPLQLRSVRRTEPFRLSPSTRMVATSPAADQATALLEGWLERLQGAAPTLSHEAGGPDRILLTVDDDPAPDRTARREGFALGREGYTLDIDTGQVRLTAATGAGLAHGVHSLVQLVLAAGQSTDATAAAGLPPIAPVVRLPAVQVRDRPRLPHRGLLLDVARHFFGPATLERLIPVLALLKLDVLHLHLTDDQGWRFPVERYPDLTRIGGHRHQTRGDGMPHGGAYTRAELEAVVTTARRHHLDVVPEIDLPGHLGAAIAAYPQLSCTGEPRPVRTSFGINPVIACPGKDGTLQLLEDVVDEVCAVFPSRLLHLGGDEVPHTAWRACPDCRSRRQAQGLPDERHLQAWMLDRLVQRARRHGRRVVVYNDGLVAGATAPDVIMQYWLERGRERRARREVAAGREVIVSDFFHTYLDAPHGLTPLRKTLSFEPAMPVLGLEPGTSPPQLRGIEAMLWTELVPNEPRLLRQLLPRLAALAEAGWSDPRLRDPQVARPRIAALCRMLERLGIAHTPMADADPPLGRSVVELARHMTGMLDREAAASFVHHLSDERRWRQRR